MPLPPGLSLTQVRRLADEVARYNETVLSARREAEEETEALEARKRQLEQVRAYPGSIEPPFSSYRAPIRPL